MMKRCSKCKVERAYSEFNKDKSRKDGLQPHCKVCLKAYCEANREKIRDQKKAYYEANRERVLTQVKAYRKANHEKILVYGKIRGKAYREANREKELARKRAYQKANLEKYREACHRRRARKLALPAEDVKLSVLRERDGDTCYLCGRVINFDWPYKFPNGRLNPDYPHIEHVIPIARGGSHTYDNTKLAHAICNIRKGDRIMGEEDAQ